MNARQETEWDVIEAYAALMGLDIDQIRTEIERRERLSRAAWAKKPDHNRMKSKAFYRYEELARYEGRQLFYNDWFNRFVIYGLPGGSKETDSMEEAFRLLHNG